MTNIELIVKYMQHECVIAHSHARSVDGFALWPVVIANAIAKLNGVITLLQIIDVRIPTC